MASEELLGSQTNSKRLTCDDLKRMAQDARRNGVEIVNRIVKKPDPKQKDPLGR